MLIREAELGNECFQNGNIVAWMVPIALYPFNTAVPAVEERPAN